MDTAGKTIVEIVHCDFSPKFDAKLILARLSFLSPIRICYYFSSASRTFHEG